MKPEYLFRKAPDQPFYCTHRDRAFYRYVCGHCDYPLTATNQVCPRCRRTVETCPVCTERTHKRPALAKGATSREARRCTVCSVRRIPTGAPIPLEDIDGSFCRNLHGCPAGGLLLFGTQEFAVLDSNARECPVCRHDSLQPLAIRAFLRACDQCLFCHELFAVDSLSTVAQHRGREQRPRGGTSAEPCLACGRRDTLISEGDKQSVAVPLYDGEPLTLPWSDFRSVVELAKTLVTDRNDERAAATLFSRWSARPFSLGSTTLERLCVALLAGTLDTDHRQALQPRISYLLGDWERRWGTTAVNLGGPASLAEPS